MSFTSPEFIVFTLAAAALYYAAGRFKLSQWPVLLCSGLVFYCAGGGLTVLYVVFAAATVYVSGLLLTRFKGQKPKKKAVVFCCLALDFGLLFYLKFHVMPLGVSFFMFQSAGYVIDVYREKYPAQRNFLKLLLFVSFFPQMVQGPISRYDALMPSLEKKRSLDWDSIRYGIMRMLWGYLKKMVIADRAAAAANSVMNDPWSFGGAMQAFGILLYCIQLYCDFSGGIDITVGIARLFGIELSENFKRPLLATSLADFWRRWHITLGSWMRDYVFYPLTLSKPFIKLGKFARKHIKGKAGKVIGTSLATFIVYLIIGLWHGANWRYIAYGFWNGGWITLSLLLDPVYRSLKTRLKIDDKKPLYRLFTVLRTNLIVFLGRYLTRAPRLKTGLWMMSRLALDLRPSELFSGRVLSLGISKWDYMIIAAGLVIMLACEFYQEKKGSLSEMLSRQKPLVQWLAMALPMAALLMFGICRGDYIASDFIYKQY